MTEEQLLELYADEIKSGEVKAEDLIDYNNMLSLDFENERYKIVKIMQKTNDLHMYFLDNLYFPRMPFYWAMESGRTDGDTSEYNRVKQTAKLFLYSNAAKKINNYLF